jgi:hypothetical protein
LLLVKLILTADSINFRRLFKDLRSSNLLSPTLEPGNPNFEKENFDKKRPTSLNQNKFSAKPILEGLPSTYAAFEQARYSSGEKLPDKGSEVIESQLPRLISTGNPRPHICHMCHKSFSRLKVLLLHERFHQLPRVYPCVQCAPCFEQQDLLFQHQRKLHRTLNSSLSPTFRHDDETKGHLRTSASLFVKDSAEAENIPVLDKFEYLDLAITLAESIPFIKSSKIDNHKVDASYTAVPIGTDDELVTKFQRQVNIGWRQFSLPYGSASGGSTFHEDHEKVDKSDPAMKSPLSLPGNPANALESRFNRLLISPNNDNTSRTNAEKLEPDSFRALHIGNSPHSAGAMSNTSGTDIRASKYGSLRPETSNFRCVSPGPTSNHLVTAYNNQDHKSYTSSDLEVDTESSHGESETDSTGENNCEPTDRPELLTALQNVSSLQNGEQRLIAVNPLSTMAKQELVDRFMREFWTIFNQNWTASPQGHGNSSPPSWTTSAYSVNSSDSAKDSSSSQAQKLQRRREADENDDGSDNGDQRGRKRPKKCITEVEISGPKFACPYRKHNPRKYGVTGGWRPCALTPLETIARVK